MVFRFLCHQGKLYTPSQEVKYIGFKVNTEDRGYPAIKDTGWQKDKLLAMVEKMLNFYNNEKAVSAFFDKKQW